jgi:ABC-type glutathione transport system ATPase component
MSAIVEVASAEKIFRGRHHQRIAALDGVDFVAEPGRRIGIIGESGSGKSTLVRLLLGLDSPTSGTVRFGGADVSALRGTELKAYRRAVQLVAQDTSSSFDPLRSLRDSVRRPALELLGMTRKQADASVDAVLTALSIDPALADRRPIQVSGGQRQRFAIARALHRDVEGRHRFVADEDLRFDDEGAVLNEIRAYCDRSGAGLVFVSHGVPATAFISQELVVMLSGTIVERGTTEDVALNSTHPYTRTLIDAYRVLAGENGVVQP